MSSRPSTHESHGHRWTRELIASWAKNTTSANPTLKSAPVMGKSDAARTMPTGASAKKPSLSKKSTCDKGDVRSVEDFAATDENQPSVLPSRP